MRMGEKKPKEKRKRLKTKEYIALYFYISLESKVKETRTLFSFFNLLGLGIRFDDRSSNLREDCLLLLGANAPVNVRIHLFFSKNRQNNRRDWHL